VIRKANKLFPLLSFVYSENGHHVILPTVAIECVALLLHIQEASVSNLYLEISYSLIIPPQNAKYTDSLVK
jgi:hypothetical protein